MRGTHGANPARTVNVNILIPNNSILGLKSFLSDLKEWEICDNLPNMAIIKNIDAVQLTLLSKMRRTLITTQKAKRGTTLPNMEVPKITWTNFEDWYTALPSVVGRQMSL